MSQCETIQHLRYHVQNQTELNRVASSCLDIVENIHESGMSDYALDRLFEFIDHIYKDGNIGLLEHLMDGVADCLICKAMANRIALQGV